MTNNSKRKIFDVSRDRYDLVCINCRVPMKFQGVIRENAIRYKCTKCKKNQTLCIDGFHKRTQGTGINGRGKPKPHNRLGCSICGEKAYAKGLCRKHYEKQKTKKAILEKENQNLKLKIEQLEKQLKAKND